MGRWQGLELMEETWGGTTWGLPMGAFEAETPHDIAWVQRGSAEKRSGVGSRRRQGG